MKRWKLILFLLVVAILAIAIHLRMASNWPYPVWTFEFSGENIDTSNTVTGGEATPSGMIAIVGAGLHYTIPHNTGDVLEDPNTGCPCSVICNGWSSYANYTNGVAHGVKSLLDEYKASPTYHGGLISLNDVSEFEQKLINKWNLEVKQ